FAHAHADQKRSHDEILISFFFNARGDELEKSTTGMYRSLLLQILRKAPDLQHVLDDFDGFPGTHTQDPTWTLESLRKLFDTAIKGMKQRRLKCFIDALDECDEEQVREMIEFLEELGQHALEAGNEVYICFASRHYPTIDIRQGRELTLENEEGHSEDLAKYVQKHLRAGKGRYIEEVRGEICEKANGVFLWAVLVIDILNREFRHGRIFAVKKRLQEIPPKLSDLFKDILRRDLANMNDLLLCLQWVLFAKRPLRREEFYFAMVAGLDSEPENISAWNTEQVTTDDMSQYVLNSSKGLAELTKSNTPTVQFIHESVRDFLLKDGGIYQLWPELGNDLCSKSHDRLKNCCQIYIHVNSSCCGSLYETLPKASSTAAKDLRTSLALRFPFLEYACQNVLYHADQAAATVPQHEFLRDLYFGALLKLKITFERYDVRRYTAGASLPYILAENGLAQLIRTARDNGAAFNVHGERYRLPLFAAIIHKHQHAIQVLLRQNEDTHEGLDIAYVDSVRDLVCREDSRKHKYLLWALQEKYESIAELVIRLTDDDRDLALKNSRGRSALSLAAELGYYRTVDLLLARGISIYSKDKSGRVPLPTVQGRVHRNGQGGGMDDALYYASSRGHEAIVRLLLEKGAGVAFVSSDFSNALDAASSRGYETVVRLLLLTGADVNDQGGPYGNALQAASLHGDENVVRLLLQNGADVNARGGPYGNALQAASYLGHETIARLILQNGAEVNAQGGRFGNAPQASSRGADEAVVRLLLDYRADVKVQGESPGTALQAARRGNGKDQEAIVRLLLKYGAIDTATDGSDVSVDSANDLPKLSPLRAKLRRLSSPIFSTEGVKVVWKDLLDAEFAGAWPGGVVHERMVGSEYSAARGGPVEKKDGKPKWSPPSPSDPKKRKEFVEKVRERILKEIKKSGSVSRAPKPVGVEGSVQGEGEVEVRV
ncbi:hypothetical protein B0A55_03970, partial [Friedmanniomyces simplex]